MDLWKRVWPCITVDGGMFLGIVLFIMTTFSLTFFVDWGSPTDGLSASQREHAEDCLMAQRTFGERALQERPECRDVLSPQPAAMTAEGR